MKKCFLLLMALMAFGIPARGEHIGIFTDAGAYSCSLPTGFSSTATVVLVGNLGTTGLRFRVEFPAGTSFYTFQTPYVTIGTLDLDLSLAFGQCIDGTVGSIPLGTIVAQWTSGTAYVRPAVGYDVVLKTDCQFNELTTYGCAAYVGTFGQCCEEPPPVASESSTWGRVKSLYR